MKRGLFKNKKVFVFSIVILVIIFISLMLYNPIFRNELENEFNVDLQSQLFQLPPFLPSLSQYQNIPTTFTTITTTPIPLTTINTPTSIQTPTQTPVPTQIPTPIPTTPVPPTQTPIPPVVNPPVTPPIQPIIPNPVNPPKPIKCCFCDYGDYKFCGTLGEKDCKKMDKFYLCEWIGGACKSHDDFKKFCEDWFKKNSQKDCDKDHSLLKPTVYGLDSNRKIVVDSYEILTKEKLKDCTTISTMATAHGLPCFYPFAEAMVCLKNAPANCNFIDVDTASCLTFEDTTAAWDYANKNKEKFQKQLGAKCVTISATQCTIGFTNPNGAFNSFCGPKIIFTITASDMCMAAGPCTLGVFCAKTGEAAFCTDVTQKVACQKCSWHLFGGAYWSLADMKVCTG